MSFYSIYKLSTEPWTGSEASSGVTSLIAGPNIAIDPPDGKGDVEITGTGTGGGGVSSLIAGTNVTLSPASGLGNVTINASAPVSVSSITSGGGLSVSPIGGTGAVTLTNTGVTTLTAASGINVNQTSGPILISNSGVTGLTQGTGISVNNSGVGQVTVANTGVTSLLAGSNIQLSGGTGAVTISSTGGGGVSSITGSTGLGVSPAGGTGAVTLSNTGVTSLLAGSNIVLSGGTGQVTVSSTAGGFTPSYASFYTSGAGIISIVPSSTRSVPWNLPYYKSTGIDTAVGDATKIQFTPNVTGINGIYNVQASVTIELTSGNQANSNSDMYLFLVTTGGTNPQSPYYPFTSAVYTSTTSDGANPQLMYHLNALVPINPITNFPVTLEVQVLNASDFAIDIPNNPQPAYSASITLFKIAEYEAPLAPTAPPTAPPSIPGPGGYPQYLT